MGKFNEDFLRKRLDANAADPGLTVVDPSRSEPQFTKVAGGQTFVINRGHAYRDHATGPSTNPRFGGPPESLENAIIKDVLVRLEQGSGKLPKVGKIAGEGTGVIFRHIPVRYNVVKTSKGIMISDYMVWQETVGSDATTWEDAVSGDWKRYE